jgi:hypothetical protein
MILCRGLNEYDVMKAKTLDKGFVQSRLQDDLEFAVGLLVSRRSALPEDSFANLTVSIEDYGVHSLSGRDAHISAVSISVK